MTRARWWHLATTVIATAAVVVLAAGARCGVAMRS